MPSRPFLSRFAVTYLRTLAVCFCTSLVALGVTRIEVATSAGWMSPTAFSQLLGLHGLLLQSFVMTAWAPAFLVWIRGDDGHHNAATSRLAFVAWLSLVAGAALLALALLSASVDDGWALAVVQPASDRQVSSTMIVGLLLSHVSTGCLGLVGWRRLPRPPHVPTDVVARAAYALLMAGAAAGGISTAGALVALRQPIAWLDPTRGGVPAGLALVAAVAATWTKGAVALSAIAVIASVGRPSGGGPVWRRSVRRLAGLASAAGLVAVTTHGAPGVWSVSQMMAAWLAQTIFVLASLVLIRRVRMGMRGGAHSRLHLALGLMASSTLAAALVFDWAVSAPFFAWLGGFVATARTWVFGAALGMTSLAGAWHVLGRRGLLRWSPALTIGGLGVSGAGLLAIIVAMMTMGTHGLALDMRRFPTDAVPLQVAVLYGGVLVVVGALLVSADTVSRFRVTRPQPPQPRR